MNSKERILSAINHEKVDRIPSDYWATSEVTNKLMKYFNINSEMKLWDKLHIDKIVGVSPEYIGPSIEQDSDYWGVRYKAQEYDKGAYQEMVFQPLANLNTIEEIEAYYTFPRADWFDFSNIADKCKKFPDNAIMAGYMAPFYMYNNIRGLEQSLIDLAINKELAHYIINRICRFLYKYHERLFEAGRGLIDITQVTDDFGTQENLMISTEMFDEFFKPHYEKFIKLAKNFKIKVFHHDDGAIKLLIPRLIQLGIDVLNPIQWRCPGMEIENLKREFGKSLCFHGAIDNQQILPFGTPNDVENEVIRCIDILASDKTGYIVAPCHNIQPNTPIENIITMYNTISHYYLK